MLRRTARRELPLLVARSARCSRFSTGATVGPSDPTSQTVGRHGQGVVARTSHTDARSSNRFASTPALSPRAPSIPSCSPRPRASPTRATRRRFDCRCGTLFPTRYPRPRTSAEALRVLGTASSAVGLVADARGDCACSRDNADLKEASRSLPRDLFFRSHCRDHLPPLLVAPGPPPLSRALPSPHAHRYRTAVGFEPCARSAPSYACRHVRDLNHSVQRAVLLARGAEVKAHTWAPQARAARRDLGSTILSEEASVSPPKRPRFGGNVSQPPSPRPHRRALYRGAEVRDLRPPRPP